MNDQKTAPPTPKQAKASTEKLYGKRTLGVLIQQALAQAGLVKDNGTSKSTDYFRALIQRQVAHTSGRLRLFLVISLGLTAFLAFGLVYFLFFKSAPLPNGDDVQGSAIAQNNRYNVFMIAGIPKDSSTKRLTGFCTAFAVSSNVLATCAHCLEVAQNDYSEVFAIMNGASQNRFEIVSTARHEGFKAGQVSADVGLVRIDGHLPYFSKLAQTSDLNKLLPGARVFLYGFPGRLADASAPEATFIQGEIGRLTTLDLSIGTPQEHKLIQHSAFTSTGTSGSPLYDARGKVIGINTGGYDEQGEKLVGYNIAVRVDLIGPLFEEL